MTARVQLDLTRTAVEVVGHRRGLRREDLATERAPFVGVHNELLRAHAEGLLPHLAWSKHADASQLAEVLSLAPRCVVLGEPAAVAAALAIAAPEDVDVLTDPEPSRVRRLLDDMDHRALLVLDGPAWVRPVATAFARKARATVHITDMAGEAIPGAHSIHDAHTGDPRFGVLGLGAQVLWERSGDEGDLIADGITRMRDRLLQPGLLENPAYHLGAYFQVAFAKHGIRERALLVPGESIGPLARWMRGTWAAVLGKEGSELGWPPHVVMVGDEAGIQALAGGPDDGVVVALVTEPATDVELEGASGADLFRTLLRKELEVLAHAMRPVVQIKMGPAGAADRAATALLYLETTLALAVRLGLEPLSLPAADRLRFA